MKLFYSKGACSLVVRIIISELALKCEFESVDLRAKKTASNQDYLKINPKGAIPALQINADTLLTENAVILQYLADSSKAYELLPPVGSIERYQVLEWLNYITTEIHKSFGVFFNPKISQDLKDDIFIPAIKLKLAFINSHLEHNKYLYGDKFTLGDAYLFVMLTWAINFKFDFTNLPNLKRYFEELKKRKSIVASLEAEGLV